MSTLIRYLVLPRWYYRKFCPSLIQVVVWMYACIVCIYIVKGAYIQVPVRRIIRTTGMWYARLGVMVICDLWFVIWVVFFWVSKTFSLGQQYVRYGDTYSRVQPVPNRYRYITSIKIQVHSSCKIEGFVETHLCKLCVILRSRVLLGVCPH